VTTGDLNGDGNLDLAVANQFSGNVSVLLGRGDGTFQAATNAAAGSGPSSAVVADLSGDAKLDLAVADSASTNVSILIGKGDGTFEAPVSFGVGDASQSVQVGDFNSDGKRDLAVVNRASATVSVLLGRVDGTFEAAVSYGTGPDPLSVVVGDFNGDGKPDLAVANSALFDEPPSVSILLGNGDGTFQAAVNQAAGISPRSLAAGDFDGDGRADLVVANYGSFGGAQLTNSNVSVLLGRGDGTFDAAVNYTAGEGPLSVTTADFNGDGKLDVAVANDRSGSVSLLLGKGDGTFEAALNFGAGLNPASIAAGDFNGDGKPDLAVVNARGVLVLLNTCAAAATDLAIVRGDTSVTLSWPLVSTGFVLESTLGLSPSNWQLAAEAATTNGDQLEVIVMLDQSERYFRLHKP